MKELLPETSPQEFKKIETGPIVAGRIDSIPPVVAESPPAKPAPTNEADADPQASASILEAPVAAKTIPPVDLSDLAPKPAASEAPRPNVDIKTPTDFGGLFDADDAGRRTSTTTAKSRIRTARSALIAAAALGGAGLLLARPHDEPSTLRLRASAARTAHLTSESAVQTLHPAPSPQAVAEPADATISVTEDEPSPLTKAEQAHKGHGKARHAAPQPKAPPVNADPSTPRPPFDIARATRAINTAAARARYCGILKPAPRQATVTVTFDPSGRVRVVRVPAPLTRTAYGSCVATVMRTARIPAYNGHEVTVSRSIASPAPLPPRTPNLQAQR